MAGKEGGIRAGKAFVELFADDSRLVRGLNAASKKLQAWGASLTATGAKMIAAGMGALGGLFGSAKAFADAGSELADMSARTGTSVEALSELGYAAQMCGADTATLEGGLRKMQKAIAEAAGGSASAQDALAALGLSVADLKSLAPDQQFMLLADRLSRIQDPARRAAAAMDIFGKSGTALLPMMTDGAAGLEAFRKHARDLGLVMSSDDAAAADEFGDLLDDLWKTIKMGIVLIGSSLAPILKQVVQWITSAAKSVGDWIRANQEIIVSVLQVAAAVSAAGIALLAIGGVLSLLGSSLGVLATIAAGVGTVLGAIGTLIGAILTPVGLVVTALAGLGAYFLYASETGEKALSWLGEQFNALCDTALAAWQGISDALAAGDIGLAAKILWLTLKMEWQRGINALQAAWLGFKGAFLSIWSSAVYGIARFATDAWAGIQIAWTETVGFLADAWTWFIGALKKGWNHFAGFFQKVWARIKGMFKKGGAEEEVARINAATAAEDQRIDEERNAKISEREKARQEKRAAIEEERQGTLAALDQMQGDEQAARERAYQAQLDQSSAELDDTRRQWEESVAEAARKRAEMPESGPDGGKRPESPLDGLDLEGMGKKSVSVQGTFNPLVAGRFGGGGVMERTAKAAEETAKNTKKIATQVQLGSTFV